jgi:drug/metabolite transporter (DMT)-like permease
MHARPLIHSRRAAYVALMALTLIWGANWAVMKFALEAVDPIVLNAQRVWLAIVVLFGVLVWQRRPLLPTSWIAVAVTAFFQTTINFGSTTMALAGGGVGRTSVLVFTMPFWTLLLAWPVLHERVKGSQWFAIGFALAGILLVVAPWNWEGDLTPKLWAVLSGFGWAASTVASKYFQRRHTLDPLDFIAWQMLIGVLPLTALPAVLTLPPTQWSVMFVLQLAYIGILSTAVGFLMWLAVLRFLPAGTASLNMFAIPVIALVSSMLIFGERLTGSEWIGIGCIAAGLAIIAITAWRDSRATCPRPRRSTVASSPRPASSATAGSSAARLRR